MINQISSFADQKVNRVLRSLYRLKTLKCDNYCPNIVLDLETKILKSSLSELSLSQLKKVSETWPSYYAQATITEVSSDIFDNQIFEKYLTQVQ